MDEQDIYNNIDSLIDDGEKEEAAKPERRNSKRFEEKVSAVIENEKCIVLNVSDKGVLLQTDMPVYFFPLSKSIDFQLQINNEWIRIRGRIMWIQSDILHSKIGISIQHAPEPYFNFLKHLYE